ncbi:hypothetical protein P3X46_028325 [Hevea brasiliensis]|uniref:Receptor-like serine/threonine-protein kinase n=1 Tax=Hevea brasiliensis TaxID=3981 RepID=A0ABQ9KNN4_HEVBR|nr:G-type lectin S-receptor-like serine/threonine-protein kinase LECRK3 [Hevea brasiliensis]KAJ9146003.1 hypothetical protein P3X46_028325 [Hevea brasiliensis]
MFLFLLLLSSPSSIFSRTATAQQINSNVSLGSVLTPTNNSYWPSHSGHFAFGFYPNGEGFAIGIWFAKSQQKTIIWTANRDDPPLPRDVTLILSSDGRLILQWEYGQQIPFANTSQPASSASMLDSGNFVLYDSDSRIIWQTFRAPTDTILPGQSLLAGEELVSSISNTNHTTGRFRLKMQRDGNLAMYPTQYAAGVDSLYWNTATFTAGDNVSLNLDTDGKLYLLNATGFNIRTLNDGQTVFGNPIYRLTIDADGLFRLYSYNLDQNGTWLVAYQDCENKCLPKGLCGLNSYCIPLDQNTKCTCPLGFDFINPGQENLGCKRKSSVDDCVSTNYTILELESITWESDSDSVVRSSNKTECRDECLRDCNCEAALFDNQECKKQKLPLRFGRTNNDGETMVTLIKISNGEMGGKERPREMPTRNDSSIMIPKNNKSGLQIGILVAGATSSTFGLIILAISVALIFKHRVSIFKVLSKKANGEFVEDFNLRSFTYEELEKATNGFNERLGRGAFGTVFKGALMNGKVIAVKRLDKVASEGELEFQNEMRSIGRTQHRNLVRLLGYCHEKSNILLVYEYMSNGSLANFLFKSETKPSWKERVQIALDIARGIHYLHEECETQIIHCDINPNNILMDEHQRARISDFGLAKLLMPNQSRTLTGVRGTRGYVAPEWYKNQPITVKTDVYSFGIMFLEIICCRRSVSVDVPDDEAILAEWVYSCSKANELLKLFSAEEVAEEVDEQALQRMVCIGLWCIQEEPSLRPSMRKVILMLEGTIEIPFPPSPASFSSVV